MKITIRALRTFTGRQGEGYSCILCIDGKIVGSVVDTAEGAEAQIRFDEGDDSPIAKAFYEHVAAQPKVILDQSDPLYKAYPDGMPMDATHFMAQIVDDFENTAKIKRLCRVQTLFRLKGDKSEIYRQIRIPFPQSKEWLAKNHPNDLEEILNENPKYQ